jgi:hypothetical protein
VLRLAIGLGADSVTAIRSKPHRKVDSIGRWRNSLTRRVAGRQNEPKESDRESHRRAQPSTELGPGPVSFVFDSTYAAVPSAKTSALVQCDGRKAESSGVPVAAAALGVSTTGTRSGLVDLATAKQV